MAQDLIDFSELENDENICPDDDREIRPPKLVQSPVIVNPILKQSSKDNLIQLYTPVQKPVKGKLKVTFGQDSVLQTPTVRKAEKRAVKLCEMTVKENPQEEATDGEIDEREEWRERTSILTSIDHQEYTQYAHEFIYDIIKSIPIKNDVETSPQSVDSGIESNAMDCSGYEAESMNFPITTEVDMSTCANNDEEDYSSKILADASNLLKALQQESMERNQSEEQFLVAKETVSAPEIAPDSEEEFMDCEEYMEVDQTDTHIVQATDVAEIDEKPMVGVENATENQPPAENRTFSNDETCKIESDYNKEEMAKPNGKPENEIPEGDCPLSEERNGSDETEDVIKESTSSGKVVVGNVDTVEQKRDDNEQEIEKGVHKLESISHDVESLSEETSDKNLDTNTKIHVDPVISNDNLEEQPILPKKGVYNLDDLDLDSMDPFKPKTQIVSSPDKTNNSNNNNSTVPQTNMVPEIKETDEGTVKFDDKSSNQTDSSSMEEKKMEAETSKAKTFENNDADIEKGGNESEKPKEKQPEKSSDKTNSDDEDVDFLEIEDPFKPKRQMQNSPVLKGNQNFDVNLDEIEDPFKPQSQMQNSPVHPATSNLKLDIDNAEKTEMGCGVSPDMKQDSINEEICVTGIPEEVKAIPAKTTNAEVNFSEDDDPFKPRSQIVNSPLVGKQKVKETEKSFEYVDDPFQPKTQIQNSPCALRVESKADTDSKAEKETNDKTETTKGIESQVENLEKNSLDNDNLEKDTGNDLDLAAIECPFKLTEQEQISLVKGEKKTEINFDETDDPFKPRSQMQNSPSSKNKQDCVTKSMKEDSDKSVENAETISNGTEPKSNAFDDIDPFKTFQKIPNSPVNDKLDSGATETSNNKADEEKVSSDGRSSPVQEKKQAEKASVSLFPDDLAGEEDDLFLEITSVTRRGEQPEGAKIAQFGDMDIDENQFVSAAQVFNDPGMLDLLEKYGTSPKQQQESSLARMSLYVKFDPLVEQAPNSRRISIRPDQLEKMREYGLDETLLLLGTPPKKRRQSQGVAKNNTPVSKLLFDKKAEQIQAQLGAVDMLLACSPGKLKEVSDTGPKESQPSSLLDETAMGDAGLFEELKYTEGDLKKVKASLKMELQGIILEKERECYAKEQTLQNEKKQLEKMVVEFKKKCNESEKKFAEFWELFDSLEKARIECEEKHKRDMEEKEKEKKKIEEERDAAWNDIQSVEKAFSDLHQRYDKSRSVFEKMKNNEQTMKNYMADCHKKTKEKIEELAALKKTNDENCKKHQQEKEKLLKANEELQTKCEAQFKMSQLKIESLEQQVEQKTKELKQLNDICNNMLSGKSES